ncbi:hypothetical protein ABID65_009008 [Bradyrhizobium sp. S3.9.2]
MGSTLVGNGPADSSMLAWRVHKFGAPDVMIFERVPRPDPGPGEVLVDVHAAGVGPWDGWIRAGKSALPQPLPLTLGSDLSGTVAAVGSGISDLAVGDQVYGVTNTQFLGGYAEYAVACEETKLAELCRSGFRSRRCGHGVARSVRPRSPRSRADGGHSWSCGKRWSLRGSARSSRSASFNRNGWGEGRRVRAFPRCRRSIGLSYATLRGKGEGRGRGTGSRRGRNANAFFSGSSHGRQADLRCVPARSRPRKVPRGHRSRLLGGSDHRAAAHNRRSHSPRRTENPRRCSSASRRCARRAHDVRRPTITAERKDRSQRRGHGRSHRARLNSG